jgi:hypothetical protein
VTFVRIRKSEVFIHLDRGMAVLDLNSIENDLTDKWLPLVGRTEDEKVTGDVNVVVIRGTLEEVSPFLLLCFPFLFVFPLFLTKF